MRFLVMGTVQGVGFRWFARRNARQLDIVGWVKNQPDGSVDVRACGREDALRRFREALRAGPEGASVEQLLEFTDDGEEEYTEFAIR